MHARGYVNSNPIAILGLLWRKSNRKRKRQFVAFSALMIASSFAEAFSIASIIPFLSILTNPQNLHENLSIQKLSNIFSFTTNYSTIWMVTLSFVSVTIIAATFRLILLWANIRIVNSISSELSEDIYRRTLYQPYYIHLERNSSFIIDGIARKVSSLTNELLKPFLNMLTSGGIILSIALTLVLLNSYVSILSLIGFAFIYFSIILFAKEKLKRNSIRVAHESTRVIKALQEGLGGIRDVLIDGTQEVYCRIYSSADRPFRAAAGTNALINSSPRYLIEALGIVLIAVLAASLVDSESEFVDSVPFLGALALGAQKALPLMQQFYAAWTTIKGSQASVAEAMMLLDQPMPQDLANYKNTTLDFIKKIELKNISFRYTSESKFVINDLSLAIKKGSKVGLIGPTGSGKSTLTDIMMGLLNPTSGKLLVDGVPITIKNIRAWQNKIAHVPQSIYLSDSTIEENIAFGVDEGNINFERVLKAAKLAQISDVIEALPNKYKTLIGERGMRLSGGQRQRIGIARAFYKQASVIFFDEATSALDNETENAVMSAINSLGKNVTLIIVAHRLTTLKNCDLIVEISDGQIKKFGTYADIVINNINQS